MIQRARTWAAAGALLLAGGGHAQDAWPAIPGIDEGAASVHSQATFVPPLGLAAVSYGIARWVDAADRAHRMQARFGVYGHLHQSNNGLGERNPGIVGNGLTVSWSRRFASERP